jgi:IstB-like ATP binding protein
MGSASCLRKTYLACALAHQACRQGLSALYVRAPRLFEEFTLWHADGSFRKRPEASAADAADRVWSGITKIIRHTLGHDHLKSRNLD